MPFCTYSTHNVYQNVLGVCVALLEVDMPVHLCLYASLLEEATGTRSEITDRPCGHHRLVSTVTPGAGTYCIAGNFHRFRGWPNIRENINSRIRCSCCSIT